MVAVIPFAYYIKGQTWDFSVKYGPPIAAGAFIAFELIPTAIMHLTHFLKNRFVQVMVNPKTGTVRFIKLNEQYTFEFNELIVTQHLPIYHKNKIDKNKRISTPWSNYSFLKIKTTDNKEFNVSSLIISGTEFPIEPTQIKYSLWPSIGDWYVNRQLEIDEANELLNQQLTDWKQKFSELTAKQLESKLRTPEHLAEIPRMAMEQLLAERKATNSR